MRHRRTPRRSHPSPPSPFRPLPAIVLLIVTSCVDVAWGSTAPVLCGTGEPEESRRQRLERILRSLGTGPLEERLDAAMDAGEVFEFDEDDEDDEAAVDNPTPEETASALFEVLEGQPDDFVGWTVLEDLTSDEEPGLVDLFRAALTSRSLNMRAIALEWFADSENVDPESIPLLERLWDGGLPDWARIHLMEALAEHFSTAHAPDFLSLTWDHDPSVRIAAIEALATILSDAAHPRLIDLARSAGRYEREAAMRAIATRTGSDAAFAAILDASRSGDRIQRVALGLLGSFHRREGDERLLEVVAQPGEPGFHIDAAEALQDSTHEAATGALVRLLGDPDVLGSNWETSTVLRVLKNRDDPSAVAGIEALAGSGRADNSDDFEKTLAYLTRDNRDDTTTTITTSCSFGSSPDPEDPDTWHVVAPHGWGSIRCAQGPGIPGESWSEPRIADGTMVTLWHRFDRGDGTWAVLSSSADFGCWVPMRSLERGGGVGPRPLDPFAIEIDLPDAALETRAVRRLIKAGAVQPFDFDEGVTGVILRPSPELSLEEIVQTLQDGPGGDAEDVIGDLLERLEAQSGEIGAPDDAEEEEE